jgi:hypothetical protein
MLSEWQIYSIGLWAPVLSAPTEQHLCSDGNRQNLLPQLLRLKSKMKGD